MTVILRDSTLGAALWLVRIYRERGCDALETRRRLVHHMDESRKASLMSASQFNWAAQHYEEAIHIVYGQRVKFPRTAD